MVHRLIKAAKRLTKHKIANYVEGNELIPVGDVDLRSRGRKLVKALDEEINVPLQDMLLCIQGFA